MRPAERLLLELLRPGGPREDAALAAGSARLLEAARVALGHGLFLLADRAVRERPALFAAATADGAYEREALGLRRRLVGAALAQEQAERGACGLLAAAGVPSALLKGAGLCRWLFGEAHLKASADVDLLVRAVDVGRADAALRGAGFEREDDRPLAFWTRRAHHAAYARRGEGFPVELHWGVSVPGFFALGEDALWSGAAWDAGGLRARLGPAVTLVQLVAHHHLHGFADLRTLVDLAWGAAGAAGAAGAVEGDAAGDVAGAGGDAGAPPIRRAGAGDVHRARLLAEAAGARVAAQVALRQIERLWGATPGARALLGVGGWGLRARAIAAATRPRLARGAGGAPAGTLALRLGLDAPSRVVWSFAKTLAPAPADVRAFSPQGRGGAAGYVRYWRWRLGRRTAAAGRDGGVR